jgi:murein DD-endopeptidase MepM/ murein hydrolase activator NlpD
VTPAALRPGVEADRARVREAARALEGLIVKQLVSASGAFKGGDAAGAGIREDLFASTLARALVDGGGIGLAAQVERSLLGEAPPPAPGPGPQLLPPASGPRLPPAGPAMGGRVSSPFGLRADPITGRPALHHGLDLAAPEGSEIRAALDGVVRRAGPRGDYGLAVELSHGDGMTTLYAHASELLVQDGERVTRGQVIARVGQTGRTTGPHLHLEVRKENRPMDPVRALKLYAGRAEEWAGSES